ncbi:MAG: hypothetical protein ACYC2T_04330 [Bacillota bacterium]
MEDHAYYQEPMEPTTESRMSRQLLVSCVGLMYLIFGLESYLGHFMVIGNSGWPVYVPLVVSLAGAVLSAAEVVRPGQKFAAVFKTFMAISILTGLVGFYFHLEAVPSVAGSGIIAATWTAMPPLPAPLSFILPGIMGLVATRGSGFKLTR